MKYGENNTYLSRNMCFSANRRKTPRANKSIPIINLAPSWFTLLYLRNLLLLDNIILLLSLLMQ